jgi:tetratricopeptide (TPR) repeat protein
LKAKRFQRVVTLGRALLEKAPRFPPLLHNLAMARIQLGDRDEGEALLRRAIEADPAYLFAPASLAQMKLQEGKLAEAREILNAVDQESGRLNPEGMAQFSLAKADLALREGRPSDAASLWDLAKEMHPEHPRLKGELKEVGMLLARGMARLEEQARKREEARMRRMLPEHPGMEEVFARRTVAELKTLARTLGLEKPRGPGKKELRAQILGRLAETDAVRASLGTLPESLRTPLRQLREAGGVMAFDVFTRTFEPLGGREQGLGVFARLFRAGLVLPGTIDGKPSVALPVELWPLLEGGPPGGP